MKKRKRLSLKQALLILNDIKQLGETTLGLIHDPKVGKKNTLKVVQAAKQAGFVKFDGQIITWRVTV